MIEDGDSDHCAFCGSRASWSVWNDVADWTQYACGRHVVRALERAGDRLGWDAVLVVETERRRSVVEKFTVLTRP